MPEQTSPPPREGPAGKPDGTGSVLAFPRSREYPSDNLPLELSSFIGREREVAEVKRLLVNGRLVTLYGPGGCGKTRLALAVAQELVEEFKDGVWWVELASTSDPDLVARAVASALGVREMPDLSLTEVLVEHLKSRKTLLVLDNCEHLIEGCVTLADSLLRTCSNLHILATSREPLRISGEASWSVPGLSLPDPGSLPPAEDLTNFEAVRLFVERAREAHSGFALAEQNAPALARLSRRLDGIPLAIELAAARIRVLTVEQILEKLEDPLALLTSGSRAAPPRHQTLRATLQWSYELLSDQERALLARLSVFAGGWTLEAAEAVGAGGRVKAGKVLDLLSALVEKSLVVAEDSPVDAGTLRYRMLEPIRQFGYEKLRESGEEPAVRLRHAEHYMAFAETAEPELLGPDQGMWLQRLRIEFGNLRAVLSWSLQPDEDSRERADELRLRLVAALWRFWDVEGFEEGKQWLQTALERDPGGFPAVRAKALGGLGFILLFQQDYGPAIAALEEAVSLYKDLGDRSGAAFALASLGWAVLHGYYRERVPAFLRESEALIEGGLEGPPRAYLGIVLAAATVWQGDLDLAKTRIEEAIDMCRELGNLREAGMAIFNLGGIELKRGDTKKAAKVFEEGARSVRQLGDMLGAAYYIWIFGSVNARLGKPVRAAKLWGAAEALRERMGMSFSRYDLAESGYEGDLAAVRSTLDEATFDAAWTEGRDMSPKQAIDYALEEPMAPDEVAREEVAPARRPAGRPKDDAGSGRRHNLPAARDRFVGRGREMAEVKRALSATRLLTITGAGGCGKTRLALEVARDLADYDPGVYPDGIWLVELAPLSEGELVPGAVAAALGVREQPDLPFTEALADFLRSRRLLLVLDNCEHLIEDCARLMDKLLSSCENLSVLATSREALWVGGETTWMAPSLTVPEAGLPADPQSLKRYESVELFVERARSRLPGFVLTRENALTVTDICRKLDGIPLAIELATARLGALSVGQISEKLEDSLGFLTSRDRTKAPRHQTLRAALEWSHDLLSESERELFKRLSVFAGGWTLAAAETMCDESPVEAGEALDLLLALVDKSLVVAETATSDTGGDERGPRYRMLEPIRQYALELLEEGGGAEEVRRLHAAFYLGLAEEAYPNLRAAQQVEWLETLERENGNLRAALSWAISIGQIVLAAWLGWALWPFWWIHGHQTEGRRWMEMIMPSRGDLPPWLRIRATIAVATMVYGQGDFEAALPYTDDLMEFSREVGGDALAEAYAHAGLGLIATARGEFEVATPHLEEALPLFREAGEDGMAAQTPTWLGTILLLQGDHEGARRRFEEGLAMARSLGERVSTHNALFNLAQLALAEGDHEEAFRRFAEGIAPSEELGDRGNIACILEGLGIVAGAKGGAERAARLLGASEALIEAIGLRGHPEYRPDRALYERIEAQARATLGETAFEAAMEEGRAMSQSQAVEYALEEPAPDREILPPSPARSPAEHSEKDTHPSAPEPPVLRIFALGAARVEKEGRPLDSRDWIHKSRELLYYLLSHSPRTKEQIGFALWPEASTAQLRSSFHDTVFRLRRALGGKEWVVFQKGRYTFDRSLSYSYDVETFEEHLSEAHRLRSGAPDQAIRHLQEATDLYGGDFLEDLAVEGEWAFVRQEELRRAYGEALLLLGVLLSEMSRHAEAAEAYRKAIAHDGFMEEAHRGLMSCYAALGERGRALRHYEELVGLLAEQLGAFPAPETTALHDRLRADEEV